MEAKRNKVWRTLFLLYALVLLWVLFARQRYDPSLPYWEQVRLYLNLRPFHTIGLYWRLLTDPVRPILTRLAIYNLAGNILLFVPMGALLPLVFPKLQGIFRTLLAAGTITVVVEVTQVLCLAGSCDVDDLILNLLGTAMGYPLHKWLKS